MKYVIPVALSNYNDYNCNGAGHKKLCTEAVDERKVRSGGKERRQDARDQVKENVGRYEEAAKDNTQAGKEAIKEVKKMFKKKASEESGRKAKAKNDN